MFSAGVVGSEMCIGESLLGLGLGVNDSWLVLPLDSRLGRKMDRLLLPLA